MSLAVPFRSPPLLGAFVGAHPKKGPEQERDESDATPDGDFFTHTKSAVIDSAIAYGGLKSPSVARVSSAVIIGGREVPFALPDFAGDVCALHVMDMLTAVNHLHRTAVVLVTGLVKLTRIWLGNYGDRCSCVDRCNCERNKNHCDDSVHAPSIVFWSLFVCAYVSQSLGGCRSV